MASYTQNYQLHQWEPEDNFLRTDFNQDFSRIDTALKGLADKVVQTVSGSYVGTGEYGAEHPSQLEFPFEPDVVVIVADKTNLLKAGTVLLRGQSQSAGIGSNYSGGSGLNLTLTWSGQALSWYGLDADYQLNREGDTYRYFALA